MRVVELQFTVVDNVTFVLLHHFMLWDTIVVNVTFNTCELILFTCNGFQQRGTTSTWTTQDQTHFTWLDNTSDVLDDLSLLLGSPFFVRFVEHHWSKQHVLRGVNKGTGGIHTCGGDVLEGDTSGS
ncbi:hypothetical protein WICPIJ_008956 [Wickerhamomyces pijperi]|uniref:Uncharacterized protein n=1 Tax=Wickerhamomyces pijperi TaxID=599730 RepID=A0A9P8PSQ7_WICPI|nr:hypothetical protein WICPIJ_008956 [Wickerhamomyces pijperi]